LESLTNKIEKMRDSKPEKELATLRKDIKTCKEEVKRLGEVMGMKNNE